MVSTVVLLLFKIFLVHLTVVFTVAYRGFDSGFSSVLVFLERVFQRLYSGFSVFYVFSVVYYGFCSYLQLFFRFSFLQIFRSHGLPLVSRRFNIPCVL